MRGGVVAVALLASALLLTGCGAPAAPTTGVTGDNGAATSGPADPGTGGGEIALPATFPTDQVPLIEGDLSYAQDLGTGWVVYVHRDDFLGGYDEAAGLLDGAGFTGDTINRDDTGATGQWVSDLLTVNLSAGDGTDLGVGPSVGYTVVKNGE
jgi:hypothetical protein